MLITYSDFTNTNFGFKANVFALRVQKVIFKMSFQRGFRSYVLSLLKFVII